MDNFTDAQVVTAHRQFTITTGEFAREMADRGWPTWKIELVAAFNLELRNPELENVQWIH